MSPGNLMEPPIQVESQTVSKLLDQYGCGPIHFAGINGDLYQRHFLFDNVIDLGAQQIVDKALASPKGLA